METLTVNGYKVVSYIDPDKAKGLAETFLVFDVRCTDGRHAIMTINNVRIRFKYEGMKREYIEIKELKRKRKQ